MNTNIDKNASFWEIKAESSWFQWKITEIWTFRHLLFRLVRRDFLIHHQQTLLGPLWMIFQPIIMLCMYVLIFEKAVGLSTDGIEPSLFYLSGIVLWTLFSESFTGTAFTFIHNGALFGKVYFPRLIIPLSVVVLNYVRFGIQFLLFFALLLYFNADNIFLHPLRWITAFIVSTATVAGIGLGSGLIFSILTAKYRDLVNVINLIVRVLMFATPVIYPLSIVETPVRKWISLNPLCSMFELFRLGFLGQGTISIADLAYSIIVMIILLLIGSILFNKFGNKLQDVI